MMQWFSCNEECDIYVGHYTWSHLIYSYTEQSNSGNDIKQVFGLRFKCITSSGVVSNLPSCVILLVTILQCWFMFQINDLPRPTFWNQSIKELGLGTYEKVITVCRKCVKCFSSISHDNVNLKMCGSNFWCTKPSLN